MTIVSGWADIAKDITLTMNEENMNNAILATDETSTANNLDLAY